MCSLFHSVTSGCKGRDSVKAGWAQMVAWEASPVAGITSPGLKRVSVTRGESQHTKDRLIPAAGAAIRSDTFLCIRAELGSFQTSVTGTEGNPWTQNESLTLRNDQRVQALSPVPAVHLHEKNRLFSQGQAKPREGQQSCKGLQWGGQMFLLWLGKGQVMKF